MKTIRQTLTRRLQLGLGAWLILGAIVVYGTTRAALTRQFDEALHTRAMALVSMVEVDHGRLVVDASDDLMREFEGPDSQVFFQVWTRAGQPAAASPSLAGDRLVPPPGIGSAPRFWNLALATGRSVRALAFAFPPHPAEDPVPHPGATAGSPVEPAILVVAADRKNLDQALATLAIILTGSSLLWLGLMGALVTRLLRTELLPLEQLAAQAEGITPTTMGVRFPTTGWPGELVPISARLNELLARLETAFARERQFSDDLAHEFRTPVAELRSLAELALKWPDSRNAETDRQVRAIALQLEYIINRLLALARNEMGLITPAWETVDLPALVATVVQSLAGRATELQIEFQSEWAAGLPVASDPTLLRSILTNLLENAVEYSVAGSTVRITGHQQNDQFTLAVTNVAANLEAADVPHLFERFWRKEAARSDAAHAGLGLALARAFATSLGCQLTAAIGSGGCLTITLSGPARVNSPFGPVPPTNQTNIN